MCRTNVSIGPASEELLLLNFSLPKLLNIVHVWWKWIPLIQGPEIKYVTIKRQSYSIPIYFRALNNNDQNCCIISRSENRWRTFRKMKDYDNGTYCLSDTRYLTFWCFLNTDPCSIFPKSLTTFHAYVFFFRRCVHS